MTKKELGLLAKNHTIVAPCGCQLGCKEGDFNLMEYCGDTCCNSGYVEHMVNLNPRAAAHVISVGYAMAMRNR
mgnify:CR=1 FL=1